MSHTNKPPRRTLLASATIAALSLALGVAWAQDQPATADPGGPRKIAGANGADKDNATSLPTVIVTAEKRAQDVTKVPSSISVVNSELLKNQHVASLVDLAGQLPGVQIDSGGTPGQTSIVIRGISSLQQGAVVATYIDDSPVGSSGNFSAASLSQVDLMPYDLERIEVLRGPQGTLYGAGAMGGLVKYVLKAPDLTATSGDVGGGVFSISDGSGTGWDGHARINLPLVQDTLGVTASVAQNKTPGYVDNAVTGQNGINAVTQKSGLLSVLWKPSDDVKLKVSALHQTMNANDNGTILLDPTTQQPVHGERQTGTLLKQPVRKQLNFYSATLNWDLHWADFTSASSYSTIFFQPTQDLSVQFGPLFPLLGAPAPGLAPFVTRIHVNKATQELRLASKPDDHVEWLAGAFFTRELSHNYQNISSLTDTGEPIAGLDPLLAGEVGPTTYKEGALFGDLTYKFNDKFDVTAGLRYARNEQTYQQRVTGGLLVPLGITYGHSAENVLTWMLSPKYQINDNTMLYARVATGYRPGGPNIALPGIPPTVKSDSLINYEAGLKSRFFDNRVSVDFDLYAINWRDIQLPATTPGGLGYTSNGGKATSRGAELSVAFRPTRNLQLGFNAGYTDAYLTEDAPALQGKNGDSIPSVPRVTWSTNADYYFDVSNGWSGHVGGDYRWTGKRWSNVSSNPYNYRERSYGVLDLNADISRNNWTVQFYVKNLTNARPHLNISYLQSALTGEVADLQSILLQPRAVGIDFNVQF